MNTKLYKQVLNLAGELVDAAQRKNQTQFDALYTRLENVCIENENTDKDHPVQWETLADFTDDFEQAVTLYKKALAKASAINAKDYMSSISYSMATMYVELEQTDAAISSLKDAKVSANKIADKELKTEIDTLLAKLSD